jgi:hypothetical protein
MKKAQEKKKTKKTAEKKSSNYAFKRIAIRFRRCAAYTM